MTEEKTLEQLAKEHPQSQLGKEGWVEVSAISSIRTHGRRQLKVRVIEDNLCPVCGNGGLETGD